MDFTRRMTRSASRAQHTTQETMETPSASGFDQRVMHDISSFTVSRNASESEEKKDDGKAEVEDKTPPLSTPLPKFLRGILQKIDVKEDIDQLNNVLAQEVTTTNYKAVLFEGDSLNTTEMSKDQQLGVLSDYLSSNTGIASCYPAATRLLELVGMKSKGESYSGGGAEASFPLEKQISLIDNLCQNLQKATNDGIPIIFKVQLGGKGKGGHGFTLTIQGKFVYQLEALASGEEKYAKTILADIMRDGQRHTLTTIVKALSLIASNKVQNRVNGANMLGLNAAGIALITDDGTAITDPMNVFWTAYPLASADEIRNRVAKQIQETREKLLSIVQNKRQKK